MFLSKIWFFLIALAAAVGLTVALVMPRPAQRAIIADEHDKLRTACSAPQRPRRCAASAERGSRSGS